MYHAGYRPFYALKLSFRLLFVNVFIRILFIYVRFVNFLSDRIHTFPTYTFSKYFPAIPARRYNCSTSVASLSLMR